MEFDKYVLGIRHCVQQFIFMQFGFYQKTQSVCQCTVVNLYLTDWFS